MTELIERPARASAFAGVPTDSVLDSAGRRFAAPAHFDDAVLVDAAFPVRAAHVATLLPSPRLRPLLLAPGISCLYIFAADYRHIVGLEPYNEVGILVPVLYAPRINLPVAPMLFPDRFPNLGFYVHALPVTTEEARDAGIEFWGFPKFLADIEFDETPSIRRRVLRAEGQHIFTLEIAKGPTVHHRDYSPLYSVRDCWLLKTWVQWEGQYCIGQFQGGASLRLGDHPLAEALKRLRVGSRAIYRDYAPSVQGLLHLPGEHLML